MADFTPEQEKEFEFRLRYEQEQAANQQQQAKQEDQNTAIDRARTIGIPVGAIAGAIAGLGLKELAELLKNTYTIINN